MQFREIIDTTRKTITKKILGNKYDEYEFFRKTPKKIIDETKNLINYHRKTCDLGEMKIFYSRNSIFLFNPFNFERHTGKMVKITNFKNEVIFNFRYIKNSRIGFRINELINYNWDNLVFFDDFYDAVIDLSGNLKIFNLKTNKSKYFFREIAMMLYEKSKVAKDIIKIYQNFEEIILLVIDKEIEIKDFLEYDSLISLIIDKYKMKNKKIIRKLPAVILHYIYFDERIYYEENNEVLNFISKNKRKFLKKFSDIKIKSFDSIIIYYLSFEIFDRIKITSEDQEEIRIIEDILKMARKLEVKNIVPRLKKVSSLKQLNNLHDKLVVKMNEQEIENIPKCEINISERNMKIGNFIVKKFKEYWNEGNIEFITNTKRLYLEGLKQSNCVYSYIWKIENGSCIILSYEEKGHIFTIEVIINENKFYVAQCLGRFNKRTEKSEEIKNKINSLNKLYPFILSKKSDF